MLMRRRAAQDARSRGMRPRALGDLDYLLGVHDPQRAGALRLRTGDGRYLSDGVNLAAPPWSTLRELEHAAWSLDRDEDADESPESEKWLRLLIAPGSSLGGARPKAGVVDESGALWIAKFPSASDERDMGAWEYVTWRLAREAGVDVPEARIERLSRRHRTFLVKRFDRVGARRVHYASAMTLAGKTDGEPASYLDIVQAITRYGGEPAADLLQLWRRLVFSICVSNVDDHLRNHGFLLQPGARGWKLAPAFDQNPSPEAGVHALAIDGIEDSNDLELARGAAKWFRVSQREAAKIIREVRAVVASWDKVAREVKLSRAEIDLMAGAFESAKP
jgi:serine/threonine-protein kinase HipA